jgi:hypothetical protein
MAVSKLNSDCSLVEAYIEDPEREDIDPEMIVQHTQDCLECFMKMQEFSQRIKEQSDLHL